jgi:hypothetical protein
VFLTSPIYLPYYLWRTRRGAGLWMLVGFITLFEAGWITQWAVFALR